MADVMMALGAYRFSIDTAALQTLDRAAAYRWNDRAVVGDKPRSEYIGPELEEITLKGVIYPFYRGGFGQVDSMRAEAGKGEPLRLVDGTGRDLQLWTIRRIEENQEKLFVRGAPRKVNFTLVLKEYAGG